MNRRVAVAAGEVCQILRRGDSARVDIDLPRRFAVGQTVQSKNLNPIGHTRLPRYARGRRGEVFLSHGVFVFPDSNAIDGATRPQHLYAVRFSARELWGEQAAGRDTVLIDLFEDYLEPVS